MTDAAVTSPTATPIAATRKRKAAAPRTMTAVKKTPAAKNAKTVKAPIVKKTAPATKPAAKSAKPVAKPVATPKPAKTKKPKMVRDSMTIPKAEYAVLDALKLRAAKLASPVKKTELLRAGIKALAAMSDAGFVVALKAVPSLKTGRPSKS